MLNLTFSSDKCIAWFKEDRRKSDAKVPKSRNSDKIPLGQGLALLAKGERKEQLKKIQQSVLVQTARCSTCAGWQPSVRAGFPMGYADLDYQSKLGLGQTDVMPDTSAELVCFA